MSAENGHFNGAQPSHFPFGEELQALIAAALAAGRPLPEVIFTLVITTHDLETRFIRSVNKAAIDHKPGGPVIVLPGDGGAR